MAPIDWISIFVFAVLPVAGIAFFVWRELRPEKETSEERSARRARERHYAAQYPRTPEISKYPAPQTDYTTDTASDTAFTDLVDALLHTRDHHHHSSSDTPDYSGGGGEFGGGGASGDWGSDSS
jgi:hypothetical protein